MQDLDNLMLVEMGLAATAAQIEKIVRKQRYVERLKTAAVHESWSVTYYWAEDGALILNGRLTPEQGALVIAALERDIEPGESWAAQRADALVALAAPDGEPNHHQVTVHVSAETLRSGVIDLDDPPEIEEGPVGNELAIGRRTRTITPALRRAVKRRDAGCRFPGCTCARFVDAHHIVHWANGGETSLDNLVSLCRHHHRLIHEGGYSVQRTEAGSFEFRNPRGVVVPVTGETRFRGNVHTLFAANTVTIDSDTTIPDWDGDNPDYEHVLWVMNQNR